MKKLAVKFPNDNWWEEQARKEAILIGYALANQERVLLALGGSLNVNPQL